MATHSNILAWRIHGLRSLVGYRPRGRTVGHDGATDHAHTEVLYLLIQAARYRQ